MKIKDETEVAKTKDKKKNKKDKKEKKKSKKLKSDENGHENNTEETVAETPESNGTLTEEQENGDPEIELTPEQKAGALKNFRISPSTVEKLKARGITYLFPIQAQTFDDIYNGEDVIGQARTGTGKTLSFALPLVEKLQEETKKKWGRMPKLLYSHYAIVTYALLLLLSLKVLVMAPTRELAKQVSDDFLSIGENISVYCIYGGTPYGPQENAIKSGLDVLVGTPGRILDHIQKGNLDLSKLKHVVLDEVDQMLDMGFADSVDEIIKSAYERDDGSKPQTLLFSATLPQWVYQTAKKYMKEDIKRINLVGSQETKAAKNVQHLAIKCGYFDRAATIGDVIQVYSGKHGRAIVFCQTKREADELAINPVIKQDAHVLHGDIPQEKREKVLQGFKNGKYKVLISTDVAARGLDIPEVDLVIQCNPPKDVDSYIHRSGRTGRAGRFGVCICFYKPQEDYDLAWVEKKAQLKFKKIGGPTPEDIIKASASDAARSLADVSDETLSHFKDSAETLIAERGATNALAAALAVISGTTKIVKRSLLSSKEVSCILVFIQ
ncbi:hypothetical protein KUTeg_003576 [Tegillarca granosa]|uniref:RNA helicase n=1 Tax=Tegillarca granosa TaxID=220873 RepID=A0ABQ9FMK4_TEGGR|nr:hypothetical protein KUTeg_003576 [Tegillarca granosa]